jgi:uncharacterized membrane protein
MRPDGPARTGDMDAIPPPWDYNPSSWRQRIRIAALAMVAFGIAAYMAAYQWRLVDGVWDPLFGSQTNEVLDSDVSHRMKVWFGIPDAALGAIAYLGDAVFGLAGSTRRWQYRPWLVIIFGIDVIPLGGVSAILVFIQAFVLGKYCFLCLVTALISLILVYWAYDEVWSTLTYLWRVWKRTRSMRVVWNVFRGQYHPEAEEVALRRGQHVG